LVIADARDFFPANLWYLQQQHKAHQVRYQHVQPVESSVLPAWDVAIGQFKCLVAQVTRTIESLRMLETMQEVEQADVAASSSSSSSSSSSTFASLADSQLCLAQPLRTLFAKMSLSDSEQRLTLSHLVCPDATAQAVVDKLVKALIRAAADMANGATKSRERFVCIRLDGS
jgi:hypothetical protein